MAKVFQSEKHLFAAMHSYIALLQNLPSLRAYSGASRLYLMTGLGVTMMSTGGLSELQHNLAKDATLLEPPLTYIKSSIAANCVVYMKMLSGLIITRLEMRGTQDQPTAGAASPRLSYNISAFLSQQLDRFVEGPRRSPWEQTTLIQNLTIMAQNEYNLLATLGGVCLPNPRRDHTVRKFLDLIPTDGQYSGMLDYDPHAFHLPLLAVVLIIARMLFADFDAARVPPAMGPLSQRLQISDSTLAALPWPSPEFVAGFAEPDAGFISTAGWRYLQAITSVYPESLTSPA